MGDSRCHKVAVMNFWDHTGDWTYMLPGNNPFVAHADFTAQNDGPYFVVRVIGKI